MPRVFEAIGRGIVGAGRAIRGGAQGGAQQATPAPMDEVPRPNAGDVNAGDSTMQKRSLMQRFGARLKRDAMNAPVERGVRALRQRIVKRRAAARTTR